jgi:hypothetical protein
MRPKTSHTINPINETNEAGNNLKNSELGSMGLYHNATKNQNLSYSHHIPNPSNSSGNTSNNAGTMQNAGNNTIGPTNHQSNLIPRSDTSFGHK